MRSCWTAKDGRIFWRAILRWLDIWTGIRETVLDPHLNHQREDTQSETHYYYRLTGRSYARAQDIYFNVVARRIEADKTGSVKTAFLVKTIRR